jgi:hypothetical protein
VGVINTHYMIILDKWCLTLLLVEECSNHPSGSATGRKVSSQAPAVIPYATKVHTMHFVSGACAAGALALTLYRQAIRSKIPSPALKSRWTS